MLSCLDGGGWRQPLQQGLLLLLLLLIYSCAATLMLEEPHSCLGLEYEIAVRCSLSNSSGVFKLPPRLDDGR